MENRNNASPYNTGRFRCVSSLIPTSNLPAYALDIGCSTGEMAEIVKRRGYVYIGNDLLREVLPTERNPEIKNAHFFQGDAQYLSLRQSFKLVLALEVIEHLTNPEKFLSEIHRILVKGGYLIISTPNKISLEGLKGRLWETMSGRKWSAWDAKHRQLFSSSKFLSILESYFSINKVCGYYYLPTIPRLSISNRLNSFMKICEKPFNRVGFQIIVLSRRN